MTDLGRETTLEPVRQGVYITQERVYTTGQHVDGDGFIWAWARIGYADRVVARRWPEETVWTIIDGRIASARSFRRRCEGR